MVSELDFCWRKCFFGLPYDFKITLKTAILQICGYPRNETSGHKNLIPRPQYNRYFCHIAIIKWSQIYKKIHQKVFFSRFFFCIHFLLNFLLCPTIWRAISVFQLPFFWSTFEKVHKMCIFSKFIQKYLTIKKLKLHSEPLENCTTFDAGILNLHYHYCFF